MARHDSTHQLIREVLHDDYLAPTVVDYTLTERVEAGLPAHLTVTLRHAQHGEVSVIEGDGVGFVDALYHGLMAHYAKDYESLKSIRFTGFMVKAHMDTSRNAKGADAVGAVAVTVHNSEGRTFEFERSGRSLVAAAVAVVVEAIEHFVNSERAFVSVYRALVDARQRGRADLTAKFTAQLSELVNTTSYATVIERIKRETL